MNSSATAIFAFNIRALGSHLYWFGMATLAIRQRKCHRGMACAAGSSFGDIQHRVLCRTPLHTHEYVGVTEFAPVPYRVFPMGKDDVGHALHLWVEREILLHHQGMLGTGDTLQETRRLDQTQLFGLFPIYPVAKALFGKWLAKAEEIIIGRNLQPIRVASLASFGIFRAYVFRASLKDNFSVDHRLAVMARAAIIAASVIRGGDTRGSRLHGKTHVHVTDPAGEFGTMDPMFENDGREVRFSGVVIDDDPAVLVGKRPPFLDTCLGERLTAENQNHGKRNEQFLVHREPPSR